MLLTIQFLSVYLWVVLFIHTHIHKIVVYNCCLSKCGLSFVKFHIHKLFYCILLSTCLSVHTYIKHFLVQIVSFCPTHTHSTLVDIVVCLVHLCLCVNLSHHTHTQNLLSCLWIAYCPSVYTHMHIYFCAIYFLLYINNHSQALYQVGP